MSCKGAIFKIMNLFIKGNKFEEKDFTNVCSYFKILLSSSEKGEQS